MSNVSVLCPHCESRFQLQPELVGKRMRCPNPLCREIFLVQEEGKVAPEPPKQALPPTPPTPREVRPGQMTGTVGDLVPILPAERAEPVPKKPAAAVKPPAAPAKPPAAPAPIAPPAKVDGPQPAGAAEWSQPPPIRDTNSTGRIEPEGRIENPVPIHSPEWEAKPEGLEANSSDEPTAFQFALPKITGEIAPKPKTDAAVETAAAEEAPIDGPTEVAAGLWDAPPVRQTAGSGELDSAETSFFADQDLLTESTEPERPVEARRRNFWIFAALLGLVIGAGGLGIWLTQAKQGDGGEEKRRQVAIKEYKEGHFAEAASMFHFLEVEFPDSPQRPVYNFMSQLSSLREPLQSTQSDPDELIKALKGFLSFLQEQAGNSLLDEHRDEVWDTLHKAAEDFTSFAAARVKKNSKEAQELLGYAQGVVKAAGKFQDPNNLSATHKIDNTANVLNKIKGELAAWEYRQALLTELTWISAHPSGNVVASSKDLVRQYALKQPELASDPEIMQLLKKMPALHRAGVKYTTLSVPPQAYATETKHFSLFFADPVQKGKTAVGAEQLPILAMAKGVLYALEPGKGKVLWVQRLGPDVNALPLWLTATPIAPERLLVLSSDPPALRAVDAGSGAILWQQALPGPCLGQPVLLGTRAFVAGQDGRISEIDIISGKLVGFFEIGQPLTGWGARQFGTTSLFFPAESHCVYILDADKHVCTGVLYSQHPSHSLRGPPLISGGAKAIAGTGLVLLKQIVGAKGMKLRVFSLPLEESEQKEDSAHTLEGWSWFAPYQTPEQLALVTDAGQFATFGLKQPGSHDLLKFFPLFQESLAKGKSSFLPPRAQVVHADGSNYWVLVHGKLYRLESGILRDKGPKLQVPWEVPLPSLGAPIQASQTRKTETGETALFLLTQPEGVPQCLLSALETPFGSLHWQQRLGLIGCNFLSHLGDAILTVDQEGQVIVFDPSLAAFAPKQDSGSGGKESAGAAWLDAGAFISRKLPAKGKPLQLFSRPEKKTLFLLSGNSIKMHLQQIPNDPKATVKGWDISLPAPMAGTAALSESALVLPLDNGTLLRYSLTGASKTSLLNWRSDQADVDAPGHVLWLGGDDFLVTDGSNGVRHIQWPEGQAEQSKDLMQLGSRIAHPPCLLPGAGGKSPRVVLADADQGITLLQINPFQVARHWPDLGTIANSPFVAGGSIGCVVEQQLLWLNPDQQKPLWKYSFAAPLVGEPRLVGKYLLAADLSGRLTFLDPQNGTPYGEGLAVPAGIVPTTVPVNWTAGHIFAPLTDGTVMLLKLDP